MKAGAIADFNSRWASRAGAARADNEDIDAVAARLGLLLDEETSEDTKVSPKKANKGSKKKSNRNTKKRSKRNSSPDHQTVASRLDAAQVADSGAELYRRRKSQPGQRKETDAGQDLARSGCCGSASAELPEGQSASGCGAGAGASSHVLPMVPLRRQSTGEGMREIWSEVVEYQASLPECDRSLKFKTAPAKLEVGSIDPFYLGRRIYINGDSKRTRSLSGFYVSTTEGLLTAGQTDGLYHPEAEGRASKAQFALEGSVEESRWVLRSKSKIVAQSGFSNLTPSAPWKVEQWFEANGAPISFSVSHHGSSPSYSSGPDF